MIVFIVNNKKTRTAKLYASFLFKTAFVEKKISSFSLGY